MNNQQRIQQIEIRIKDTQSSINHWKEVIQQHESSLQTLCQQLTEIKTKLNIK